ncbi:MAG: hypothetical protein QOJ89_3478 [bacterium]|jgi:uncharacterized protein with GYD domain
MTQTYIILCDFKSSAGLAKLAAGGAKFKKQAAAIGHTLKDVELLDVYLTRGGTIDVVVLVETSSDDRAREMLVLFDGMGPVESTILTVTTTVAKGTLKAFNGHTKM